MIPYPSTFNIRRALPSLLILGLLPLLYLVINTSTPSHKEKGKLLVVATTGIIGDALKEIGQDKITIKTLMNAGVDPHTYELTAQDGDVLTEADLIFYNGLYLEGPLDETFQKIIKRKDKKIYAVSEAISPDDILTAPHSPLGQDPHIWHSVTLWKEAVLYISEQLQQADPEHALFYEANTKAYIAELDALHEEIIATIATIPTRLRILVTAHDAFEYFGKTYGVTVKSLQGISTTSEPGIKDREDLTAFIISHQIKTIFAETSVPSKGIQAVIESCRKQGYLIESNALLYSDSLAEEDSEAGTYIGMMRTNLSYIIAATQ